MLDPRKTWRSTFWFMTGLSAATFLGGMLSFDADKPSTEKDKCVIIISVQFHELTVFPRFSWQCSHPLSTTRSLMSSTRTHSHPRCLGDHLYDNLLLDEFD